VSAPLDLPTIADLLAATVTTVTDELRGLGREAGWRPAPVEWSASECVGHLIEADQRGFGGRIRAILATHPGSPVTLQSWDPPAVAAAREDHLRDPEELIAEFAALRADGVALVRSVRAEDLARSGDHPEVGELRVDELLAEWVHHDRNHVRQMLAVTQARIWDQMGNAQRFSLLEVD
jgi:hypothetical protein